MKPIFQRDETLAVKFRAYLHGKDLFVQTLVSPGDKPDSYWESPASPS